MKSDLISLFAICNLLSPLPLPLFDASHFFPLFFTEFREKKVSKKWRQKWCHEWCWWFGVHQFGSVFFEFFWIFFWFLNFFENWWEISSRRPWFWGWKIYFSKKFFNFIQATLILTLLCFKFQVMLKWSFLFQKTTELRSTRSFHRFVRSSSMFFVFSVCLFGANFFMRLKFQ